ncbi:MAG: hypothetical protein Q9174_005850, partial [Haloplaca sp. 1 TL-2023]
LSSHKKMNAIGIELPRSARSGHPIFTSDSDPGKPHSTQAPTSSHFPSLTERFAYVPPSSAKKQQEQPRKRKPRKMPSEQGAFAELHSRSNPILSQAPVGSKKATPPLENVEHIPIISSPARTDAKVMKLKRHIIDLCSDEDENYQPEPKRTAFHQKSGKATNPSLSTPQINDGRVSLASELADTTKPSAAKTRKNPSRYPTFLPERARSRSTAPNITPEPPSSDSTLPPEQNQIAGTNVEAQKLGKTTLQIINPSSKYDAEVYVPIKLRSCATNDLIFATAAQAWDLPIDEVSALQIAFHGNEADVGKGTMRLKRDMDASFECFMERVESDGAWLEGGGGKLVVGVAIELKPETA